jgi:hypothetical protein
MFVLHLEVRASVKRVVTRTYTVEGWSRDVTVDIADELRRRYVEFGEVPDSILDFMDANRR